MNITASGLVLNDDSPLTIKEPVGTFVMVPNSDHGTLITEGSSVVMAGGEYGTHTVLEGEVISTGNEKIPPSDVGTVVRDGEGGLLLYQKLRHQWTTLILSFVFWKLPLV